MLVMDATPTAGGPDLTPFGLPVLAELPDLAGALERLVEVDRLLAEVISTLVLLHDRGTVEQVAGVSVDHFLSIVARRTRSDAAMLRCAVRACRRFPSLHRAFADGEVSWAQLRAVALVTDRVPHVDDVALDSEVAGAISACAGADPDALAGMVRRVIDALRPQEAEQTTAPLEDEGFLHLQPRLDGTGGRFHGDVGPVGFALLDRATRTGPLDVPATRTSFAGPADPDASAQAARTAGRTRLTNLLARLATRHADPDAEHGHGASEPAVTLLLRAELDTLVQRSGQGAQLLTTLAGGAMHVDGATARRLAEHATSLRLIVTDHGRVVGVGRRTSSPPDWLVDAIRAVHDTCSAPGCTRPALTAHTDHAAPWTSGGPTDAANCAPLCPSDNLAKERDGWRALGQPDGTRHWHHPRSGLRVTTHPATKRPPPRPDG
jgi:hypothetical protein